MSRINIPITITPNVEGASQKLRAVFSVLDKDTSRQIVKKISDRYISFLRKRYISLSAGGGSWPALKQSTVIRKTRRGIARNAQWILREGDDLLNGIERRNSKLGAVTVTTVGYITNRAHPRSKKSLKWLARYHARRGREIVVPPSPKVRTEMNEIANQEVRLALSKFR